MSAPSSTNGDNEPKATKPTQRTLADVRSQVAQEIAFRAMSKAEVFEGVKVGVTLMMSKSDDEQFLRLVASVIKHTLLLQQFLFAIAASGTAESASSLIIFGSSEDFVQRAVLLASSKFLGRVEVVENEGTEWVAVVRDIGTSSYDERALWDVVRKSARKAVEPSKPPPGSRGIDQILSDTRAKLCRITPAQAYEELKDANAPEPVFLVDIRPAAQREKEGGIHGSLIIERNVLEWRFDPRCDSRLSIVDRYDLRVIIFCQEGYTSSLAAYALHELGLLNATDVIGGYRAWKEAGLPVDVMHL
jgi:rhodanese-related sulfurtransferase